MLTELLSALDVLEPVVGALLAYPFRTHLPLLAKTNKGQYSASVSALRLWREGGVVLLFRGALSGALGHLIYRRVDHDVRRGEGQFADVMRVVREWTHWQEWIVFAIATVASYPSYAITCRMVSQPDSYPSCTQAVVRTVDVLGWQGFFTGVSTVIVNSLVGLAASEVVFRSLPRRIPPSRIVPGLRNGIDMDERTHTAVRVSLTRLLWFLLGYPLTLVGHRMLINPDCSTWLLALRSLRQDAPRSWVRWLYLGWVATLNSPTCAKMVEDTNRRCFGVVRRKIHRFLGDRLIRRKRVELQREMAAAETTDSIEELRKSYLDLRVTHCCIVCMDHPRDILLRPCNHFLLCDRCMDEHKARSPKPTCPTCRSPIEEIVKVHG